MRAEGRRALVFIVCSLDVNEDLDEEERRD
jgi:hypothetical protein